MEIGFNIKRARKKANYTQYEAAIELDIPIKTLIAYEKNREVPTQELLEKMAELFECDITFLLHGDEKSPLESNDFAKIKKMYERDLDLIQYRINTLEQFLLEYYHLDERVNSINIEIQNPTVLCGGVGISVSEQFYLTKGVYQVEIENEDQEKLELELWSRFGREYYLMFSSDREPRVVKPIEIDRSGRYFLHYNSHTKWKVTINKIT